MLPYQRHTYASVQSVLQKEGHLPAKHQYASLALFLADQGLLRVGRCLQKADLPQETKHSVLLSTRTVRLLVQSHSYSTCRNIDCDGKTLIEIPHPQTNTIKGLSRKCITCRRTYARVVQQRMGELPSSRVIPARPFSTIGVDLTGPVTYKEGNVRNQL